MKNIYINNEILANAINLNKETVRNILRSYKFARFRTIKRFKSKRLREAFLMDDSFAQEFIDYLDLRCKYKEINKFKDFYKRTFGGKQ